MEKVAKKTIVLREKLEGAGFYDAMAVLEFARGVHVGVRKDGVTPEIDHQLSIALFALTLPALLHPEATICTILLHDSGEDYDVSQAEWRSLIRDPETARLTVDGAERVTKVRRGVKRDEKQLFDEMAKDPCASITKGCDRLINQNDMAGVFGREKIIEQIDETKRLILPMLKRASANFPHQRRSYLNLKFGLTSQIGIFESFLDTQSRSA